VDSTVIEQAEKLAGGDQDVEQNAAADGGGT
jgi:hypothetical protein